MPFITLTPPNTMPSFYVFYLTVYLLQDTLITATGGNGVFLSRYNRGHTINGSEFTLIGDSAIASAGYANYTDVTKGDFPHDGVVEANHIHDIGLFGKQTSGYEGKVATYEQKDDQRRHRERPCERPCVGER